MAGAPPLEKALALVVLATFAYLGLVYAANLALALFAAVESAVRGRDRRSEDLETLARSRFTIPVSVVVPARDEEGMILAVVESLLAFRYPEYEVVVVNDGSTDATGRLLRERFDLEPVEVNVRRRFPTRESGTILRSRRDGRLTVVDRVRGGGKADALNAGLDVARFPYVCCVDADTLYRPDALVTAMRVAVRDPTRVVGITSQVAVATRPDIRDRGGRGSRDLERSLLGAFQHLEYLRTFLNQRLAWSRLDFMLCASGAFMVWRRDVLEAVGGFSSAFSCEDIELTFRVHERFLGSGEAYAIVALPEPVGTTEGPRDLRGLVAQRARWHRVVLETVWHYRRMLGRPRYREVGLVGIPFYLVSEVLAPLLELAGVTALAITFFLGTFGLVEYGLLLALVAFANGVLTSLAVVLEDRAGREYRPAAIGWMLALGPLEPLVYRPILIWARLVGTWQFLRGQRSWGGPLPGAAAHPQVER